MIFEEQQKIYVEATSTTKTKLDFTLFDREFIIALGEKIKELEEIIKNQNELIVKILKKQEDE